MTKKACTICGAKKPLKDFYFLKTRNTYKSSCKNCDKKGKRENYAKNMKFKTCNLCQDEFWTGNLHSFKLDNMDYRLCGVCKDGLLSGEFDEPEPEGNYFNREQEVHTSNLYMEGPGIDEIRKKSRQNMIDSGNVKIYKPGDPGFDDVAKNYNRS